jgi:hypothetical protein
MNDTVMDSRKILESVTKLALQSNRRHAKFAARILAFSANREEACTEVVEVNCTTSRITA